MKIFNMDIQCFREGKIKKLAHAYFKRPYFSKFFGGKIKNFNIGCLITRFEQSRQYLQNFISKKAILHNTRSNQM